MAYNYQIPMANDKLSISQGQIVNNFGVLGVIAGNSNASSSSLNTTSGFNWVYLANQGSQPPAGSAFVAQAIALYSSTNATTTINELYVNKTNEATVVQVPITAGSLSINSAPLSNAGCWTYLPSGLLIQTGNVTGALSGLVTVNLTGGPGFTQLLSVLVCPYSGASASDLDFAVRLVSIVSPSSFDVYFSNRTTMGAASVGTTGCQFFVIGY